MAAKLSDEILPDNRLCIMALKSPLESEPVVFELLPLSVDIGELSPPPAICPLACSEANCCITLV